MKLYSYFRSSAAYRVRIGLNLKGIVAPQQPIHLLRDGGEQLKPAYQAVNPQMRVPALELDDGTVLTQSLAILDYVDETHPEPPLLPRDPVARAHVRAVALAIACDIHPVNNLVVLKYLRHELSAEKPAVDSWYRHWVEEGFKAIEQLIEGKSFCFGDMPTLADICLIPQVYNARRYEVDMTPFPKIVAVDAHARTLSAFADAAPDRQPDSE